MFNSPYSENTWSFQRHRGRSEYSKLFFERNWFSIYSDGDGFFIAPVKVSAVTPVLSDHELSFIFNDEDTNVSGDTFNYETLMMNTPTTTSTLSLLVPSLSSFPTVVSSDFSSEKEKRKYRQAVAIPRYLEKRKRRVWVHDLMHPSRRKAALRRARNGGQFGVLTANFLSASELWRFPEEPPEWIQQHR